MILNNMKVNLKFSSEILTFGRLKIVRQPRNRTDIYKRTITFEALYKASFKNI